MMDQMDRRSLIKGMMALPVVHEIAAPGQVEAKDHLKFAVIGLDHNHIMSITGAMLRGGGELVAVVFHQSSWTGRVS